MKLMIALAFAALPLTAFAEQLSLKGLRPGMPIVEARYAAPHLFERCMEGKDGRSPSCYFNAKYDKKPETLANRPVLTWLSTHDGMKLQGMLITLAGAEFDHVVAAMTEKWGAPKVEKSVVQNRAGASFDQVEARWTQGEDRLTVSKRGNKVDEMMVTLSSESSARARAEERAKAAKGAAKDL